MAQATDQQMQTFASDRLRTGAEAVRALVLRMESDKAAMDDIFARATNGPVWADTRTDGPPHLLSEQDHLKWNAFITDITAAIKGHAEYANVLKMCVRSVG